MKVIVDREKCIGAANCAGIASGTFRLDKEKKAVVLDAAAHDDPTLFEAAEACPTEAISLFNDRGERLFP